MKHLHDPFVNPTDRPSRAASLKMSPVINSTDGEEKRTR
jgi:hypothetical protein